jgi:hypothetical protein
MAHQPSTASRANGRIHAKRGDLHLEIGFLDKVIKGGDLDSGSAIK